MNPTCHNVYRRFLGGVESEYELHHNAYAKWVTGNMASRFIKRYKTYRFGVIFRVVNRVGSLLRVFGAR